MLDCLHFNLGFGEARMEGNGRRRKEKEPHSRSRATASDVALVVMRARPKCESQPRA